MLTRQKLLLFNQRDPRVLLEDLFNGSAINGNYWTVTDTESKLSVSGGNLVCAGGKAAPAWGDPAAVSKAPYCWARVAGLTIEWQVTPGGTGNYQEFGFTDGSLAADGIELHAFQLSPGGLLSVFANAGSIITPFTHSAAQVLWCKIVCKATGAYYYVSTDSRSTWDLIWIDSSVTVTPFYAFIESLDAALTASACYVSLGSVKPSVMSVTPAASTPSLGSELATGNLVVGNYYSITATQANYFYTGCAIGHEFRATATTALDANNKVKLVGLASAHVETRDVGKKNGVYRYHPTASAGSPQGMAICLDDETNPQWELQVITDGTNVALATWEAGVGAAALINTSTGVSYSAGRELRAVVNSTKVAVYYESSPNVLTQIGTTQTVANIASYGTRAAGLDPSGSGNCGLLEVDV